MSDYTLVFRPSVAQNKPENIIHRDNACPFCDHNQLNKIYREEGGCIWLENKYRTLDRTLQTVLIESPRHDGDISNYSREENRHIFRFALRAWEEMIASGRFRSVLLYKNYGPMAGGSLAHPHMQIVGLESYDGYSNLDEVNLNGYPVETSLPAEVSVSDNPIMGFVEMNASISDRESGHIDALADAVQVLVKYALQDYDGGSTNSYNLFFYHYKERYYVKITLRWIVSTYFVGYRIPQVFDQGVMTHIVRDLEERFRRLSNDI